MLNRSEDLNGGGPQTAPSRRGSVSAQRFCAVHAKALAKLELPETGSIDVTLMMFVFGSNVPVTLTVCAANLAGVF